MGKGTCCNVVLTVLVVLGIGLLISGIIIVVLGSFTSLAHEKIKENLPLKEGSTSFENWEKPEGDFFIEYYLFNITNLDIRPPGVKEVGPYIYRRKSATNVIKRLGQTLTINPETEYYYDKSRSCKNCDPSKDKITAVNYPLLVLLRGIQLNSQNITDVAKGVQATRIEETLNANGISLFQERSVHEFLWGYQDTTLSVVAQAITKQQFPSSFALQFNKSGSGFSKIHTGEYDVDRVAEYLEWKNKTKLNWWNSDTSNMINGTGGTRFKPFIEEDDELYVLVTEICRSLKITYDSTVEVHGIDLYRFTPPEDVLLNGIVNPENKGFCVTGPAKTCLPSGLLDVNACKGGPLKAPPFVASTPLFYNGDPVLSKDFNLTPNKEKHATFIDIEPNTGITMQGHKRLQLNFAIQRSLNIRNILLNVNTSDVLFLPSFFTDESATISEEDASDFKTNVLLPLRVAKAMPYVMIGLGGLLIIFVIIIAICRRNKSKRLNDSHKGMGNESYSM